MKEVGNYKLGGWGRKVEGGKMRMGEIRLDNREMRVDAKILK